MPRTALSVLYVLRITDSGCATYGGLQTALGLTYEGVRLACRMGENAGVLDRKRYGTGRGAKTVVYLTPKARRLLAFVFQDEVIAADDPPSEVT